MCFAGCNGVFYHALIYKNCLFPWCLFERKCTVRYGVTKVVGDKNTVFWCVVGIIDVSGGTCCTKLHRTVYRNVVIAKKCCTVTWII